MSRGLLLLLCLSSVSAWTQTSPTIASGETAVTEYNGVVLVCKNDNLVVTNLKFTPYKGVAENCYQTVVGPEGFLIAETTNLRTSKDGVNWSSVQDPNFTISPINNQYYFGGANGYTTCAESSTGKYPHTTQKVQCATSSDLSAWKMGPIWSNSGFPGFQANDTVILLQTSYTPDNITYFYNGWVYDIVETFEWTQLYAYNTSMKNGNFFSLPYVMVSNIENGWLVGSFNDKLDIEETQWTDDFKTFTPVMTTKTAQYLKYASTGCRLADGTAIISGQLDYYVYSKTPSVKTSWKPLVVPNSPAGEHLYLNCAGNGIVLSTTYGSLYQASSPSSKFTRVYNGLTAPIIGMETSGKTLYAPTLFGAAWLSKDAGKTWSQSSNGQTTLVYTKYVNAKGQVVFVGANLTMAFTTMDWVNFEYLSIPLKRAYRAQGPVGITVFKNSIYMLWQNTTTFDGSPALVVSTPLPLTSKSEWAVNFEYTPGKYYDDTISYIAGDDESGFLVTSGEGELYVSADGKSFKTIKFLDHFDRVLGLQSGNGNIYALFDIEEANFTQEIAVYRIYSTGEVRQVHAFGKEYSQEPAYTCPSNNCLYFNTDSKEFYYTLQNNDVQTSADFTNVTTFNIPGAPTFTTALIAGTVGDYVVGFFNTASGGSVYIE